MRLLMLITAVVLGGMTPVAANALLGGLFTRSVAASAPAASTASAAPAVKASGSVSALTVPKPVTPKPADAQIDDWIDRLSKEPKFEAWKNASWSKYPIGPGNHGWVVIVKDAASGMETGYLVVWETENGTLQLEEYGIGDLPLFSQRTLSWALGSEGLEGVKFTKKAAVERIYFDALHAYWKVSEGKITRYADAKTGEWLPIGERELLSLAEVPSPQGERTGAGAGAKSVHVLAKRVADPYMNIAWITGKPISIRGWNDLLKTLGGKDEAPVYRADLFDGLMMVPMGVAGVHAWKANVGNEALDSFVAVEQEGLRYIPFDRLAANGSFVH
ncbi:hypothetical protein [Paenibacillus thermotolerans]|uniref:hypothetical protein n=1 Tax=Paenibacillus thermotolerans TaxID=3027807 RepID=UPI0023678BE1|nr:MULTISPECIES: hypothetical protein [unclassified Paenibacillus]